MQKKIFNKYIIYSIIVLGAIFRLVLFSVSPPNNTYDDHLEVINIYAQSSKLPSPSQCWECYQPPLYYVLSAVIFRTAKSFNAHITIIWKCVQLINPILSILVLLLFYKILCRFNISVRKTILYMSFIAVLPVDILTSSMIGNDYLLVFSAVASLFYYLRCLEYLYKRKKIPVGKFILLSLFAITGSLSKQHGLILIIFPTLILCAHLKHHKRFAYTILLPLLSICVLISASNELWKYKETGKILVSNQHYFDYAKNQFPGSLDRVEFTSFRYVALFQDPFISDKTSASFPTEIFARTFFDYEWRFLSPKIPIANIVGRIAYILGFTWLIYFLFMIVNVASEKNKIFSSLRWEHLALLVPVIVGLLFVMVPILQTIRYPYFSSMKTTFMLPGLIILIVTHAIATKNIELSPKCIVLLTTINILYGAILITTIYSFTEICLNHLHGPLWHFPI
ncbi:MAG: hypothetical protein HXX13_11165 [Bacteroidetes bacterium]|nr:hypothetical protein [Bacteroidota bacterium]